VARAAAARCGCVLTLALAAPVSRRYDRPMRVATGTVVDGKVVLEGVSLPDGTVVTVLAADSPSTVRLSAALRAELEQALTEADRDAGISADELFDKLRKYG